MGTVFYLGWSGPVSLFVSFVFGTLLLLKSDTNLRDKVRFDLNPSVDDRLTIQQIKKK